MAILVDNNTRLIVQGITGRMGAAYTRSIMTYGTTVVAGVTPGKGGEWFDSKIPIFDTVRSAMEATEANASLIFVPPTAASDAMYEAANVGIPLVVCVSAGIPIHDMMKIVQYLKRTNTMLIGPNSPGIMTPRQASVGIIPGFIVHPGKIGLVSSSSSLTYEVIHTLSEAGLGQSTCVGIGSDPIVGTGFIEILDLFDHDPDTEQIVLIGEIGGYAEIDAAEYIKLRMTKPVVAFIAGHAVQHHIDIGGRSGTFFHSEQRGAEAKVKALQSAGARIAETPEQIPSLLLL